jgi:hypothetical protein
MFLPSLIQIRSRRKKANEHVQQLTLQREGMSVREDLAASAGCRAEHLFERSHTVMDWSESSRRLFLHARWRERDVHRQSHLRADS